MTTTYVGTTFPKAYQWHIDEIQIIDNVKNQIDIAYPDTKNLLINTTWFGPQFDNGEYTKFLDIVSSESFDNLFLLAAVDPVFLNSEQIANIETLSGVSSIFLLGHFDTEYYFNFHSTVLPKYFYQYTNDQLVMKTPYWKFLNYNRKPRDHRTEFVNKLIANKLESVGIVTLGNTLTLDEKIADYAEGNWGLADTYGIPHDIHSLGRMDIWQNHFLTVVSETEFLPWDNMFISEKTWKPILGLRQFVINGQTKIYKYLRDNGFHTFNHYFNSIELEHINELKVHDSIIAVIKYLTNLDEKEISAMYKDMLPALEHNRNRFFEFAKEQQYKIEHLFE
jgi:hypothetical protein